MKVARWGNSLAIRIPSDIAKALRLKAGDEVELTGGSGALIEVRRRDVAAQLRPYRGLLPAGSFDRDAANAR